MTEKPRKKQQSSDSSPIKKKEGWITDQDMWDVTLDMIEDATMDYSLIDGTSDEKQAVSAPHQQAGQQKVPGKPAQRKSQAHASAVREKARLLQQQRKNSHPQTSAQLSPSPKPVAPVTANPQLVAEKARATRELSSKNSVRKATQESQLVDYHLDRRDPPIANANPGLQKNKSMITPKANAVANKKSMAAKTNVRAAQGKSIGVSNKPGGRQGEQVRKTAGQENYAKFSVNEVSGSTETQDLTAVMKKVKRDKKLKSLFWVVPGILRLWLPITTAVLGFALGNYVGGGKQEITMENSTTVGSLVKQKDKVEMTAKSKLTKRQKPDYTKSPSPVERTKSLPGKMDSSSVSGGESDTPLSQAFDGVDLALSEQSAELTIGATEGMDFDQPERNLDMATDEVVSKETLSESVADEQLIARPLTKKDLPALIEDNFRKFNAKDWHGVISISDKILSVDPHETSALTNRSVAYTELGVYAFAIDDVNIVISVEPDNALAINNRGYAYEKMGEIKKSVADYDLACKLGIKVSCTEATRLRRTFSNQIE